MNERLNELRLDAGIAQLKDDPRLVVIDREGNVIDPLIGLAKFAELIVRECANQCDLLLDHKISSEWARGTHDCSKAIRKHFGVEE